MLESQTQCVRTNMLDGLQVRRSRPEVSKAFVVDVRLKVKLEANILRISHPLTPRTKTSTVVHNEMFINVTLQVTTNSSTHRNEGQSNKL
jgi:hypothetical protein